jgi:hypothetical protein
MTASAQTLFLGLIDHARRHRLSGWPQRYDSGTVQELLEDAKLSYGDALKQAKLKTMAVKAGHLAGQIARFCMRNKLPPLNALLVNARTRTPGEHYLGGDPIIDLFASLCFDWNDDLVKAIRNAIIVVPVFKNSYW